ncbi:Trans-resveratrol di-O-methyltransferase [Acorus calamus]|uniref:Trans-resveratrol di-O-methyltransferase n=1 Tax=Acorus calamus TaxID=4465 RepID=A0AAV9DNB5_ACOCL|nr:Trans-resveratrol di-O-methyltransferase [Acorus calamus]
MLVFTGCFANVSKEGEEEKYVLTPVSRLLVKDNDRGLSPFLFFELDPVMQSPWQSLGKWFHSDQPTSFAKAHGVEIFEMAGRPSVFFIDNDVLGDQCLHRRPPIDNATAFFIDGAL